MDTSITAQIEETLEKLRKERDQAAEAFHAARHNLNSIDATIRETEKSLLEAYKAK